MNYTIYEIAKLEGDEMESLSNNFEADFLDNVPLDELGEHLIEEYHHEDVEDYECFDCEEEYLDTDEIGYKIDPDAEDEGYLVLVTSVSVTLRYFKRTNY